MLAPWRKSSTLLFFALSDQVPGTTLWTYPFGGLPLNLSSMVTHPALTSTLRGGYYYYPVTGEKTKAL